MLPDSFPQFLYPCCTSLLNRRELSSLKDKESAEHEISKKAQREAKAKEGYLKCFNKYMEKPSCRVSTLLLVLEGEDIDRADFESDYQWGNYHEAVIGYELENFYTSSFRVDDAPVAKKGSAENGLDSLVRPIEFIKWCLDSKAPLAWYIRELVIEMLSDYPKYKNDDTTRNGINPVDGLVDSSDDELLEKNTKDALPKARIVKILAKNTRPYKDEFRKAFSMLGNKASAHEIATYINKNKDIYTTIKKSVPNVEIICHLSNGEEKTLNWAQFTKCIQKIRREIENI